MYYDSYGFLRARTLPSFALSLWIFWNGISAKIDHFFTLAFALSFAFGQVHHFKIYITSNLKSANIMYSPKLIKIINRRHIYHNSIDSI